jgi:hypothetical protein
MAITGTLTDYLENKLINHLLRNTVYTPPASVWIALYTISPSETKRGVEVIGGGYTRMQVTFTISGNSAINSATIEFPEATANWGTIVGVSIMDAATSGNMLFWGEISNPLTLNAGEIYSIYDGLLIIELLGGIKGGWGDGIPQQVLNHVLNNSAMSSPGTNVYLALGNTLVTDAEHTFVSWTETTTSGTTYSRKQITSWYAPTTGSTTNLSDVVFASPPLGTGWGRIENVAIFNASTSGDVLLWGRLRAPIYIISGDGLKFVAGDIDITLN